MRKAKKVPKHEFYRTANSNNLDIAVLEWYKVFGEWNGKHHWRKIFAINPFRKSLLTSLKLSEKDFCDYIDSIAIYRNTFIAHLDETHIMNIPKLDVMYKSTIFLLNRIYRENTYKSYFFHNEVKQPDVEYKALIAKGKEAYLAINNLSHEN